MSADVDAAEEGDVPGHADNVPALHCDEFRLVTDGAPGALLSTKSVRRGEGYPMDLIRPDDAQLRRGADDLQRDDRQAARR